MRSNLKVTALLAVSILCPLGAAEIPAQAWPTKPVRIIVPFAPGGTADTLGRLVAQRLTESFKENFIVENRAGAGGAIGSDLVAKAAPDGYTLVVSGVAHLCILPALSKTVPYDPMRDFTHIALFGGPPGVLVIHPSLPAKDLRQFIAYAKAEGGKLSYGSPGNGTHGQLVAELLQRLENSKTIRGRVESFLILMRAKLVLGQNAHGPNCT